MEQQRLSAPAFWALAVLLGAVLSPLVAWALLFLLDAVLGSLSLNVWGDAEGLVVPFFLLTFGVFAVGLLGTWLVRRSRSRGQQPI